MKINTFDVKANIPQKLMPLRTMAYNMYFAWSYEIIELFRRLDVSIWDSTYNNPVKMLNIISQEKIDCAINDESFLAYIDTVHKKFKHYLEEDTWFHSTFPNMAKNQPVIAYFSMEFGIDECLPIYSGGLGVLSGDHLKAASDLGIPLVGIGLCYREGYFKQYLNSDGWQQESYPENEFHHLPLTLETTAKKKPILIEIPLQNRTVYAQIWRCDVGKIPLFLLDTNVPKNAEPDREITAQLYGGNTDMRIKQEIIIGIGGARALQALNLSPTVFHMNEGHAALSSLERIRQLMSAEKLSFKEALEYVKSTSVFTTHTPVPAGNDRFNPADLRHYLEQIIHQIGLSDPDFFALGRENPSDDKETFCMTVLALKTANFSNGVSKLHGSVSRKMWKNVWPNLPMADIPIRHITNGIHIRSWISHDLADLLNLYLGTRWSRNPQEKEVWQNIDLVPDIELWGTHERRRERLVGFARKRVQSQLKQRGAAATEIERSKELLNPKALTIGFARRFATYKRATLIFQDMERIKAILLNEKHPVQLIFAGKAHPKDNPGKTFIQNIVKLANQEEFRNKIVFIEDYDLNVGRYLVQGCDIWLNNPRRPLEASGTSGMKAAANGVLNLSVLDGWWDEAYNAKNGWAIGLGEEYQDNELQDHIESNHLFNLLEKEVIPIFYDRGIDNIPRKWVEKIKECIRSNCPEFNTSRMVCDYTNYFYTPAYALSQTLSDKHYTTLKAFTKWKKELQAYWKDIKVLSVKSNLSPEVKVGDKAVFSAQIHLGACESKDIHVELYYGLVNSENIISNPETVILECAHSSDNNTFEYSGEIECRLSGKYGYTVRILPQSELMPHPFEPHLITWFEE